MLCFFFPIGNINSFEQGLNPQDVFLCCLVHRSSSTIPQQNKWTPPSVKMHVLTSHSYLQLTSCTALPLLPPLVLSKTSSSLERPPGCRQLRAAGSCSNLRERELELLCLSTHKLQVPESCQLHLSWNPPTPWLLTFTTFTGNELLDLELSEINWFLFQSIQMDRI